MSPCWNCLQRMHCLCRGGRKPCNYYIGPAGEEAPSWQVDSANQLPRKWHVRPNAVAKVDHTKTRHA
jgi:hypothetical protein